VRIHPKKKKKKKITQASYQNHPRQIVHQTLSWKNTQVVQHLPSKCEALNSNINATKKKKKKGLDVAVPSL
jgi:hypothetical protein